MATLLGRTTLLAMALPLALSPTPGHAQVDVAAVEPLAVQRGRQEWMVLGVGLAVALVADQSVRGIMQSPEDSREALTLTGNGFGDPRYMIPALGGLAAFGFVARSPQARQAAIHAAAATAVAATIAIGAKFVVGRLRPDEGGRSDAFRPFSGLASFPSGHTAVSAAIASALAAHTKSSPIRIAAYGAIVLTGVARMRDDRHWLSDVVAGYAVGKLSVSLVERIGHGQVDPMLSPSGVGLRIQF